MSNRRYQRLSDFSDDNQLNLSSYDTSLPTDAQIAIYYRQSTEAQIGNISTTLQTVDMVKYLQARGWHDDDIYMIDMDAGVSGTKKIDERAGMRHLFGLITTDKIKAVACQDEDRLFRDITQIQVNIFIEACKEHRVLVITPSMVYDFAHPHMGIHHARQFRFKCEMAAEYINAFIKGRLHTARRSLLLSGRWAGPPMPTGYMADMRRTLPDGSQNENWRRFTIFESFACVVREYYKIFLAHAGNASKALRYIQQNGPYFPDPNVCTPPEGFKTVYRLHCIDGRWYIKAKQSFIRMLTNAAYIGHWAVNDTIVRWNNHPPIVDEATFYKAFNYLSQVTLDGNVNQHHRAANQNTRPTKDAARKPERPLFTGLMFAPWEGGLRQVGTKYKPHYGNYYYALVTPDGFGTVLWSKKADFVDAAVAALLLDKLKLTFNYDQWETSVYASTSNFEEQIQLKEAQIKQLDTIMENLITSLAALSTPALITNVEQKYREAQAEHQRLHQDLNILQSNLADIEQIRALTGSFTQVVEAWDDMATDERREVVHVFVDQIIATKIDDKLQLDIRWKDGSSDQIQLLRLTSGGTVWLPTEIDLLLELVESGASKLEIAKAFPDRTWRTLYCKYRYLTKKSFPREEKNTIYKHETYNEYIKRKGLDGEASNNSEGDSTIKFGTGAGLTAATAPATLRKSPMRGASSVTSTIPL